MEDEIQKIIETQGAYRPGLRPTALCEVCSEPIRFCCGPKNAPHWKHISKGKIDHVPNNESETHRLAKEKLVQYLNSGYKLKYVTEYVEKVEWKSKYVENFAPLDIILYKTEIPYQKSYFDIAGYDKNNNLRFCIEIYCTHRTVNVLDRIKIGWIELKATEVLEKLYKFDNNKESYITIKDYSRVFYDTRLLDECAIILEYLDRGGELELYAETLSLTAFKVEGYYLTYDRYGLKWNEYKLDTNDMWVIIINKKKCIRCKGKYPEIKLKKPYCRKCYRIIVNKSYFGDNLRKFPLPREIQERHELPSYDVENWFYMYIPIES